jgi:hypothetical protein
MIKQLVIGFFFVVFMLPLKMQASEQVQDAVPAWDNSQVEYRGPSADTMAHYRSLEEYRYDRVVVKRSWWRDFLNWLGKWFANSLGDMNWFAYFLLACAIFVLVFFIFRLAGVPIKGLFVFSGTKSVTNLPFSTSLIDIDDENLENQLQLFIGNKAYREATRVLYLLCLRLLNNKKHILWRAWKTDREYYYELKNPAFKSTFKQLMTSYEYVWYGCFEPDDNAFEGLKEAFDSFSATVKNNGRDEV